MKNPTFKMSRAMAGVAMCSLLLDLQIQDAVKSGLMVEIVKLSDKFSRVEFRNRRTGRPFLSTQYMNEEDRLLMARHAAARLVVQIEKIIAKKAPANPLRKGARL